MVVNLFRSFLAVTGFGLMSFTFTFWSHHQWDQVLHRHEEKRHYHGLRTTEHRTVSHPSSPRASTTNTTRVNPTNTTSEQEGVPIIHIVYTRFMQHQPDLISLGLARMELLNEFFVQSLLGQSTHNFLVVIRTDPHLNPVIKQPLLTLFPNVTQQPQQPSNPYPFRYLVIGSNNNPKSHQYAHLVQQLEQRNDGDGDGDTIWSGTLQNAKDYLRMASTGPKIIMETRLDSDDGLHTEYLEQLQDQARETFQTALTTSTATTTTTSTSDAGVWRMWCANKYLEWQYMAPWDLKHKNKSKGDGNNTIPHHHHDKEKDKTLSEGQNSMDQETNSDSSGGLGALIVSRYGGCLSAGITLAYLVEGPQPWQESITNPNNRELPSLQRHETLATTIPHCEDDSNDEQQQRQQQHHDSPATNCLTMIKLHPSVVRARTPTSAGMLNIFWDWKTSRGSPIDQHVQEKNHQPQEHSKKEISSSSVVSQSSKSPVEVTSAYRMYQKLALEQQPYQEKLWSLVPRVFGMTPTRIRHLRDYMTRNMAAIAKDNLMGQCSAGHSCKESSQVMLRKIVAET